MLLTDIHVRTFIGSQLRSYLHSIAKLRIDVFREYPYLAEPDLEETTLYLKRFTTSKEAIGVLVFDNTTLIGASLGIPLSLEREEYQKPFLEKHLEVSHYFFFSDSVLLKNYRGRGIGHHFFDIREAHVLHLKRYQQVCFAVPLQVEKDPLTPTDYMPLNDFWRKRGYVHWPQLVTHVSWKEVDTNKLVDKQMTFWIKDCYPSSQKN